MWRAGNNLGRNRKDKGTRRLSHVPRKRAQGEQARLGEGVGGEQGCAPEGQAAWVPFLSRLLLSCVTLGKAIGLSVPQFPLSNTGAR